jgi:mannosyl-3-phosphoglycerate phosphatase
MKLIIFTDLDGTLLEYYTYSLKTAQPALDLIKEKNIPLIICSSKTKREIEYYRKKLENSHPFISENGGGIFIPKGYFKFQISDFGFTTEETQNYLFIRLGARYADLRKAVISLQGEGFRVKGFGDMTIEEVAKASKLSLEEAAMAKERYFDEPFLFEGSDEEKTKLLEAIRSKGFNFTQGMFYHILGLSDKGKAVSILTELYKRESGEIITVAIGDSPNDIPMLEKVDRPVVVQKPDGNYEAEINIPELIKADGIGPEGWNKAVLKFLK